MHQPVQSQRTAERNRTYDQHQRNPEAKRFYNSVAWLHARGLQLSTFPVCQRCQRVFAEHVHHIKPLARCSDAEKIDPANLLSACPPCHNALEAECESLDDDLSQVSGMLKLAEDETYYYDAEAAEKPIRFIEKYIVHTEGRELKGKPFLLEPIQKQILRDVHGYKHRDTKLRRFKNVWWNGAVGCGKSPLLAAVGVAELIALGEPGEQLYCMAADYSQARVIFEQAKAYIKANPQLLARCDVLQYEIRCKTNHAVWRIISGKGPKAGCRPGAIFGDECHQWKSDECYNDLVERMAKKPEPICWIATNTAEKAGGIYDQLQKEAEEVLAGVRIDPSLYPILWCADKELAIDDPEAWRQANPLLGVTMSEANLREKLAGQKGNPAEEAKFRRLYLGQRVTGSNKWIDAELFKASEGPVDPDNLSELEMYIGLDLSQNDDLCCAAQVWTCPERYYVKTTFWLPAVTANFYQSKEGIPYDTWIADGDLIAVDETTITPEVQARIAAAVIMMAEGQKAKPIVAYDRYKADKVIAAIEAAGIECMPVAQGFSVSPGCQELERRLKAGSITFHPNGVMRMCAANVEVKSDAHGCIWPVKPNARGKYAGKRGAKIDGIAATVTGMTEALRRELKPAETTWDGSVILDLGDN